MREPLLLTRLTPPRPPGDAVPRPRLLALLDGMWSRRLTTIAAPAGYGKSILLAQWLAEARDAGAGAAFVSLSDFAPGTAEFAAYLAAAFSGVDASIGKTTGELLDLQPVPPAATLLNPLINDLAVYSKPVALVLDDVDELAGIPPGELIEYLLKHTPANLHVLLSGRSTAAFTDSALALDGDVLRIGADELSFSAAEIERLFDGYEDCAASEKDRAAVERITEGWPAGVRLALLACRDSTAGWESWLSGGQVLEALLFKDVYDRLGVEKQAILTAAALPDRFAPNLVADMTGLDPSQVQRSLREVSAAGLFLTPIGEAGQWWRFHPLFREFLLAEIARTEPEVRAGLHLRAGNWFTRRHQYEKAVRHFEQAHAFEQIREIILLQGDLLTMRGESQILRAWCEMLPPEVREEDPVVGVWYAWSLVLTGAAAGSQRAAGVFEKAASRAAEEEDWPEARRLDYAGHAAAVRSTAALISGDLDTAGRLALEAREKLSPEDSVTRNLMDQQLSGVYVRTGNTQAALELLPKTVAASLETGRPRLHIVALQRLAYLHVLQGRLHEADRAYREIIRYAGTEHLSVVSAPARLYYANNVLREWDRLDEALEISARALADCRRGGIPGWVVEALMIHGRILGERGDRAAAEVCFREAEEIVDREANPDLDSYLQSWVARERIRTGELKPVRRWVRYCGLDVEDDLKYDREKDHLTYCAALIALGETDTARHMLTRIEREARRAARWYRVIEALLLLASALDRGGAVSRARGLVVQAIQIAEPHGFRRIFINAGDPVMRFLAEMKDGAADVIAFARDLTGSAPAAGAASETHEDLPGEQLAEREREILALLAAGHTNAVIAERLQLGLNTVRWHNGNIYRKLDAANRTQAAAIAREHGLV